jgi:tetratricopeptide (TPR) repeat protein
VTLSDSHDPASNAAQFSAIFGLPPLGVSHRLPAAERLVDLFFPDAFAGYDAAGSGTEAWLDRSPSGWAEAERSPAIQTLALAQLYIDQGFVAEAREMLEQIVSADPANLEAWAKLDRLRTSTSDAGSAEDVLKRWLGAVEALKRQRELPLFV